MDVHLNKKIKDYFFKKLLGKGNFGSVYLVEDTVNKCLAACKVINKEKIIQTPKLGELINSEIMVLYNCQDKNIVNYQASFQDEYFVYIVMQYCNGGDLDQYVQSKGGRLAQEEAKFILNQIVKGFKSFRGISAVHRDFKPENVLINNGVIKIADLGFSKILSDQQNKTHTVLGTLYTMAPQIISKKPYGSQCDIWSLGIVYYYLLYGTFPYIGNTYSEMLKKIQFSRVQFNPSIPITNASKDFIMRCLVIEPNKRITWQQIQNHTLIANFPKVLPTLKIPQQILKTQQFFIRNCYILRIQNPATFPDVALSSAITEQRLKDPLEKKVLQNRIHSYYQSIYLAIRGYINLRITNSIQIIEDLIGLGQLKNIIFIQLHSSVGYIISRETLRQITQLLQSLSQKQNIFQFTHMANQFFISQECQSLIQLFKNDQNTMIHYVAKFKNSMNKDDLLKLETNQVSVPEKILQRQKRHIIQYAIQLFNNINKVNKKSVINIFILIQFLSDEVECKYKVPQVYSSFTTNQDLKIVWATTKEILSKLKKNYQ